MRTILEADKASTREMYEKNFEGFTKWFNEEYSDISLFAREAVVRYMVIKFNEGLQYSTIHNYRYAIHPVIKLGIGSSITDGYEITRIMANVRKSRPARKIPHGCRYSAEVPCFPEV